MRGLTTSIHSLLEETQRELAVFASETMGAQSYLGQFDAGRLSRRRERRRLRDLVEGSPLPCLIIDPRPGLRIVDINDPYAEATITRRDRIAGEKLFDVFPDNPEAAGANGVSNLYESLREAAQTGLPHAMALQRYDVRDATGHFVERHWRPTNIPIFDEDGRLICLLHQGNPVTQA